MNRTKIGAAQIKANANETVFGGRGSCSRNR